eukprot:scaffold31518_cov19-Prasinocladus_malaysianus.AAC.1
MLQQAHLQLQLSSRDFHALSANRQVFISYRRTALLERHQSDAWRIVGDERCLASTSALRADSKSAQWWIMLREKKNEKAVLLDVWLTKYAESAFSGHSYQTDPMPEGQEGTSFNSEK